MAMKLTVIGAAGRMGRALAEVAGAGPETALHACVKRGDDLAAALDGSDGILDFTTPETSVQVAALAAERGLVHVIGTTGFSSEDDAAIAAASAKARIVKSGNMSLGVNLLAVLVEEAARALGPDAFDLEILEMHHRHKVDAPSGTALLLGEAAAKGRAIALAEHSVRTRDGHTGPRPTGAIGFATMRGGSVIGDHRVVLAGEGERIEIAHLAQDRSIYARGAVKAALWARGRAPGLYSMRDVLGL